MLDYLQPDFDMPHFKSKPRIPLNAFLTAYLEAGGSHHLAIAEGHGLGRIEKAAGLMGVELVTL